MSDSRPHIAILGAGPAGLEAALAALDHGFPFTLYEASEQVAAHVREWGHVRLFSPWGLNISPRMRRHLEAAGRELPSHESEVCPTGQELVDIALQPIAELPRVAPNLKTGVRVQQIGREGLLKHEEIGSEERRTRRFRLLVTNGPQEWIEHADVVLDCTGTWSNPNTLGDGGIAAPGEAGAAISRSIPDVSKDERYWADRKILLVGAGHSAQTAAIDLAKLAESHPDTKIYWALRSEDPAWRIDPEDPLPERSRLIAAAMHLCEEPDSPVETIRGVSVEALAPLNGGYQVTLRHRSGERKDLVIDRILSLTGFIGDHSIYRQLQVHECYATSGPMKLAAALLGSDSDDCLTQESHGAETLVNPEPNFFILGSKSYGRNTTFLMRVGWQQVEEVFSLLTAA
jgi:hypothetical protein